MDDRLIIFLALSTQIQVGLDNLDSGDLDEEGTRVTQYVLQRSLELIEQYREDLEKPNTIQRPKWKDLKKP